MYISTREIVISIICNACGVLGLILWAIEAHKSNASQCIQSVESVENNGDIIVRSNLEPFRVAEMDKCYKCKWWNYSYGCSNKKGICDFESIAEQTERSE